MPSPRLFVLLNLIIQCHLVIAARKFLMLNRYFCFNYNNNENNDYNQNNNNNKNLLFAC